jgi:hypothetical protein
MPTSQYKNAHGPARNAILHWWHNRKKPSNFFDLDTCGEGELKRAARYLGVPIAQLRWVARYSPDPIDLLERRMEALCLEPNEVAHIEPLMFREFQQRCVKCEKRGQCALDLADKFADPAWQYWRDYCPNAATLSMLSTLQSCSKVHQ